MAAPFGSAGATPAFAAKLTLNPIPDALDVVATNPSGGSRFEPVPS